MVDLSIVFCMLTMVKPSIATPGVSVSISSKSIITPFPFSRWQELMLKEKQEQSDAQFKKEKEEVRSWTAEVEGRTDWIF